MPHARTGKAEELSVLIAAGESLAEASRRLGVPDRTARRWAAGSSFRTRVAGLRRRMTDQAVGRLAALATEAVGALAAILKDKHTPPAARVSAARGILADLVRLTEALDLEERLARLEALEEGRSADGKRNT